jgi:hypothetical protein
VKVNGHDAIDIGRVREFLARKGFGEAGTLSYIPSILESVKAESEIAIQRSDRWYK